VSQKALGLIAGAEAIFVSSASMWEIAIKVRLGKMKADPEELLFHLSESGFQELPVWSRHAIMVAQLPLYHSDPFDRFADCAGDERAAASGDDGCEVKAV